jgi:hypothetical protein
MEYEMAKYVLIATMNKALSADELQGDSLLGLLARYKNVSDGNGALVNILSSEEVTGTNGSVRPPSTDDPLKFRLSESELTYQRFSHNPPPGSNDQLRFPSVLRVQFCEVFDSIEAYLRFHQQHGDALKFLCEYVTLIRASELKPGVQPY